MASRGDLKVAWSPNCHTSVRSGDPPMLQLTFICLSFGAYTHTHTHTHTSTPTKRMFSSSRWNTWCYFYLIHIQSFILFPRVNNECVICWIQMEGSSQIMHVCLFFLHVLNLNSGLVLKNCSFNWHFESPTFKLKMKLAVYFVQFLLCMNISFFWALVICSADFSWRAVTYIRPMIHTVKTLQTHDGEILKRCTKYIDLYGNRWEEDEGGRS